MYQIETKGVIASKWNTGLYGLEPEIEKVAVHGFKGSEVQGSVLVPVSILEAYLCEKRSASSLPIWKLPAHWQLRGKASIYCKDFGSSILSLSLTLNVEPWTYERLIEKVACVFVKLCYYYQY